MPFREGCPPTHGGRQSNSYKTPTATSQRPSISNSSINDRAPCASTKDNPVLQVRPKPTKSHLSGDSSVNDQTTLHLPYTHEDTDTFSFIDIKVVCWNIRGIGTKLEQQDNIDFLFQNDIVFLTETHKDPDFSIHIPGYIYKNFSRHTKHAKAKRYSGGIGVFYKQSLVPRIKVTSHSEHVVWIRIQNETTSKNDSYTYIACVYFPPDNSPYARNNICNYFEELQDEISMHIGSPILLCGDFNARTQCLDDVLPDIPGSDGKAFSAISPNITADIDVGPRRNKDQAIANNHGRKLIELCQGLDLCILNGRVGADSDNFTCYKENGQSVVDYLIVSRNNMQLITKFMLSSKKTDSDHVALIFSVSLQCSNTKPISVKSDQIYYKRYKWDPKEKDEYVNTFYEEESLAYLEFLICGATSTYSVDELCEDFYRLLEYSVKRVSKKKSITLRNTFPHNKWFDDECKEMKKSVNEYALQHDLTNSLCRDEYGKKLRNYKTLLQRKKRKYFYEIRTELEQMVTTNPQHYWDFWKKHKKRTVSDIEIDKFTSYFQNQVHPPLQTDFVDINLTHVLYSGQPSSAHDIISDDILNRVITPVEVMLSLRKLKNKKAPGIDGIPAEFLKAAEKELIEPLTLLFNYILQAGKYPSVWCEGMINPLHKKGCTLDPDNYRKITVLPALGKIFESILCSRLTAKNDILLDNDPFQSGFMKDRRTTDNAFILYSLIMKQKFLKKPLYVCFVDFTKAFDYVNRAALMYKLKQRGVGGAFFR